MFDTLSDGLSRALDAVRGTGRLTDENIADALRQVRVALLEADVALPVVKSFIADVRKRATGQEVIRSLTPGQTLIKIVHDELVRLMGEPGADLSLKGKPAVVLLAGVQGSGKTTTAVKLALWLEKQQGKKTMLCSTDIYRPAALLQLERLAGENNLSCHAATTDKNPLEILHAACDVATQIDARVLIVDTAGRQHVDEFMMHEIRDLSEAAQPTETLMVVDSMAGQDAIRQAAVFNEALTLTGIVLTKVDGDARGGAALSVRHTTGVPIRFLGSGEKVDALEQFDPERLASRILGMGDVVGLVEEVQQNVDSDQARRLAHKVRKGRGFDLADLRDQLRQMLSMGGLGAILDKLPVGGIAAGALDRLPDEREIRRQIAMIDAMTLAERRFPKTINGSRRRRIAGGSGVTVQDVNRLLKQYKGLEKVLNRASKMKGKGLEGLLQGIPRR